MPGVGIGVVGVDGGAAGCEKIGRLYHIYCYIYISILKIDVGWLGGIAGGGFVGACQLGRAAGGAWWRCGGKMGSVGCAGGAGALFVLRRLRQARKGFVERRLWGAVGWRCGKGIGTRSCWRVGRRVDVRRRRPAKHMYLYTCLSPILPPGITAATTTASASATPEIRRRYRAKAHFAGSISLNLLLGVMDMHQLNGRSGARISFVRYSDTFPH